MKVMVIVKATKESEAGVLPDTEGLTEMLKYNEELVKSGVILAGDGLQPTSKGKRPTMERTSSSTTAMGRTTSSGGASRPPDATVPPRA